MRHCSSMALYRAARKVPRCFPRTFFAMKLSFSLSVRALDYSGSKTNASLDQPELQLPLLLEAVTLDLVCCFHSFLGN